MTDSDTFPKAENPEYTLTIGTSGELPGFSYYEGDELTGHEIELACCLCEYLNAKPKFVTASFDGLLTGISTGKYDLIVSNLFVTDERKDVIKYSDPYRSTYIGYVVKDGSEKPVSFFSKLKQSLNKALLKQNRWKMLLNGLGTTLIITFFGFILANIFGIILCAMSMSKKKALNVIAKIYTWIMQGMPIVVVLMIIYYIIFAKFTISGVVVSIIAFGMSTGASLGLTFKGAISGVHRGQWEAAYALGFSKVETFFGVILPQATVGMMSGYFGQLIALMKGTAVVGYVAVLDLTKVGDVIRASTFDAFVPLLIVAIAYMIMAAIMIYLSDLILKKIDPKLKKRVVKGVKVDG